MLLQKFATTVFILRNMVVHFNTPSPHSHTLLKGTWQRDGFSRGFCINQFGIGPLYYISSCSDFDFEFTEIFVIKKRLAESVNSKPKSERLERQCKGSMRNQFMQNPRKSASLSYPFKKRILTWKTQKITRTNVNL